MKKKDESYKIPFKGLMFLSLGCDETLVNRVINDLELHLRRFYMEDGYGAVIFDGKNFIFTTVEKDG